MRKTLPIRLFAIVLCMAMLLTVTPIFAVAESVTYLDYNETTGKVDTERTASVDNVIDDGTDSFVTGWNIITSDVEFKNRIVLPKDVNLILANGVTLTAKKGIEVAVDGNFSIYAQSNDEMTMGKLIVPDADEDDAGIGSSKNSDCGNIVIYGGVVTTQGGENGAGIGSGAQITCGNITIYGGVVNAQGGYGSAGIGSAFYGKCGNITIHGGVVTALGDSIGAGIGSGRNGECGNIAIYGGVVTANSAKYGAGVGGGLYGSCNEVTIAGGVVNAESGMYGAGIGAGFGASCTKVTISGGYIKATTGIDADSIGTGFSCELSVPVSIDDSCTSVTKDGSQYINYEPFAKVEPTCTTVGTSAYVTDYISGNYYTSFPFTEDGLIGDAAALATWKAEGGDGYLAMTPHKDEDEDDKCDVCHAVHATYLDYNETTGNVDTECEVWGVHVVDESKVPLVSGWNIVKGNVTIENRITLPKNVKLILEDGATLTAKKGITVENKSDFAIYAQSNDKGTMGKLIVPEGVSGSASIGNLGGGPTCGDILICGGMVTVQGGTTGIGSGDGSSCGNIIIRGGVVTAQGSNAGIGSGWQASCGDITISGGIVTAIGRNFSAGIGSGYYRSSCGAITISGGYVKAIAGYAYAASGSGGQPIGAGDQSSCGTVSIDSSCTSVIDGPTQYINYLIPKLEPTCTESGFEAYYIDPLNDTYYSALSLAEDKVIGDETALAVWKAENGGGYIAPLGHEWQFVDETTHKCTRCETVTAHTGVDDFVCDDCGGILLETAIAVTKAQGEAKAAFTAAAGENPSETLANILSDACAAVDEATTLDAVANAKVQGLSDIEDQKEIELEAERSKILPECEKILASDEYSDMVKSMVREFVTKLNLAENLQDLEYTEYMYAPAIRLRIARDTWIPQIEGLLPEEPSVTVRKIVEDACSLILNGEDMSVFSYVYDITALAVERQLTAETVQEALAALLRQTESNLEEANCTIAELNNTITTKDATIAEKQEALETANEQLKTAKAALEVATAKVAELEDVVSEQDEALKKAVQDLENKQAALDEMTEKYNTVSAAFDDVKKALDEVKAAKEQVQEELAAANGIIASKDATIAEKQEAIDATQKALDAAKSKVVELEATVSEQDETLKQAKQDMKTLQEEIARLEALLEDKPIDPQPTETIGDANGDGAVDMKDVLVLRKQLAGMDVTCNEENADCNGDGTVDMKDVLQLRKYLAGLVETLGV